MPGRPLRARGPVRAPPAVVVSSVLLAMLRTDLIILLSVLRVVSRSGTLRDQSKPVVNGTGKNEVNNLFPVVCRAGYSPAVGTGWPAPTPQPRSLPIGHEVRKSP